MCNKLITIYRGVSQNDGEEIITSKVITCSDLNHYRKNTKLGYVYLTTDIGAALRYGLHSDASLKEIYPCYVFKILVPCDILEIDEEEKSHFKLENDFFYKVKGNINLTKYKTFYALIESCLFESPNGIELLLSWNNSYELDSQKRFYKDYSEYVKQCLEWKKLD